MLERLKQVGMTYITWRWMWLMLPLTLLMMLGAAFQATFQQGGDQTPFFAGTFGIGMPIVLGVQWFASVAKWQFADPRARLMPGYTWPHILVIFTVLTIFLVVNPLLQAFCMGISPLGPLAYSLLLGGLFLYAIHLNRGLLALPMLIVFFSGMYPESSRIWFSGADNFQAYHVAGIFLGAAMFGWWLLKLAALHEEDEAYFVLPLGTPGSMSRLERVLQGRLQGRKASREGFWKNSSDRWHNRLVTFSESPNSAALFEYGWGQFSFLTQAISAGIGIALYGIFLGTVFHELHSKNSENPGNLFVYAVAFALPAIGAMVFLRTRRVRMASELLRPASRTAYFAGLFGSLAKWTLYAWLSMSVGLWVVLMTGQRTMEGSFTQ